MSEIEIHGPVFEVGQRVNFHGSIGVVTKAEMTESLGGADDLPFRYQRIEVMMEPGQNTRWSEGPAHGYCAVPPAEEPCSCGHIGKVHEYSEETRSYRCFHQSEVRMYNLRYDCACESFRPVQEAARV